VKKEGIRNVPSKSGLKSIPKKVLQAVEGKNPEEARKALAGAIPRFQKAAAKDTIHKKPPARKISLLNLRREFLSSPT